MPRLSFDAQYERDRIYVASRVRVGFEGLWTRDGARVMGDGGAISGPFGDMVRDEIQGRFASGPRPFQTLDSDGNHTGDYHGYPTRWAQLVALADLAHNPIQQAVRQLSLLYQMPIRVGGDIVSPAWRWLRDRCGLDLTLQKKQRYQIGVGSCAVRPTIEEFDTDQYYPTSVTVVQPDQCIAIPDPSRPHRPAVFIELLKKSHVGLYGANGRRMGVGGNCLVWDMSDPRFPRFGEWDSPESWQDSAAPIWHLSGRNYPFWWLGEPIMPVTCVQWDPVGGELLPVSESDLQSMLDLILQRTWCHVVAHAGSFQKALLLSKHEAKGLRQSMLDPNVIHNVWAPDGSVDVKVIPDSLDSATKMWSILRDRTEEWASRFDVGFEVRKSEGAKSGVAILLELTGKYLLRQRMETAARDADISIVRSICATHNDLIRRGQLSLRFDGENIRWNPSQPAERRFEYLIPEGNITIDYPHQWNATEEKEVRARLEEAVNAGRESPRALWLLDHGLEDDRPDGPNWILADESIRQALGDRREYRTLGYGVEWKDVPPHVVDSGVPDDSTIEHIPPRDVGLTAAEGMRLRSIYRSRAKALYGNETIANSLRNTAKRLIEGDAFSVGEIRRLSLWLEANGQQSEVGADGTWGDRTDPSGDYITYLSQGGDEAAIWCDSVLNAPVEPPVETDEESA